MQFTIVSGRWLLVSVRPYPSEISPLHFLDEVLQVMRAVVLGMFVTDTRVAELLKISRAPWAEVLDLLKCPVVENGVVTVHSHVVYMK